MRRTAGALAIVAIVGGCAHSSDSTYDPADVGRPIETAQGSVVASRVVDVTGETDYVGPVAGGVLGAAGSGLAYGGGGAGLVALIAGVVGAGVGYLVQEQINSREGIEYVVRMDDGRVVTLVQNRESDEVPMADGTPVLVQFGDDYTRIIEDPTGGVPPASEEWVDPDSVPYGPPGPGGPDEPVDPMDPEFTFQSSQTS